MRQRCNASVAGITGILLLFSVAAPANEANDATDRLTLLAREQAKVGKLRELRQTVGEVTNLLPDASPEGSSAMGEQDRYLVNQGDAVQSQDTSTTTTPEPGGAPLEPAQESPLPLPGVSGPLSPSALSLAPVPLTVVPVPAEAPKPLNSKLIDLLRRQGDAALSIGDISAARRFYQRGAEAGCAACAEALALTHDAAQLRRMGAVGIKPDPAQAEVWRARARKLGWTGAP